MRLTVSPLPPVKTNNSHLPMKARLRAEAVRQTGLDRLRVLDAFAGEGKVWQEVERLCPGVEFEYVRIDKKKYSGHQTIQANNLKVMPSLGLSQFDLIDLDAYGWPHEQLLLCAERAPDVPVVATCIMQPRSKVPTKVLIGCGVPADWIDYRKVGGVVFNRWRAEFWDDFCARLGYSWTVKHIGQSTDALKIYQILYTNRR